MFIRVFEHSRVVSSTRKSARTLNYVHCSKIFLPAIVSQLDKCLKFKSIQGEGGGDDKSDCIILKITPRNVMNFRHLSSCGSVEAIISRSKTILNRRNHCLSQLFQGVFRASKVLGQNWNPLAKKWLQLSL